MKFVTIAALALAFSAAGVHAAPKPGGLEVQKAWSRPAAAGTTGVGYMTIANHGKAADALLAVESPLSAKVEMHRSSMAGGVMRMAQQDRVVVPAGGAATFGPGGYHLMLLNLNRALKPGDAAPATLVFASGARIKVSFKVSGGAGPPDPMAGMGH